MGRKIEKMHSQMVGTELAGPFMLLPLMVVEQQHKPTCPHGVPVTVGTRSCTHGGGAAVLRWPRPSSWLMGGQYIRLYALRPQASKAFKHLLTPKLVSNSSGVS